MLFTTKSKLNQMFRAFASSPNILDFDFGRIILFGFVINEL